MKKLVALLLVMVMVMGLSACSSTDNNGTAENEITENESSDDSNAAEDSNEEGEAAEGEIAEEETGDNDNSSTVSAEAFDAYARPRVKESLKVGLLMQTSTDEALLRAVRQAEIEANYRGWEIVTVEYSNDEDCVSAFTNLIAQDVDAIFLNSISGIEAKTSVVEQAREAGIGVYALDTGITDGIITNVSSTNGLAAMELFYQVAADTGWDAGCAFLYLGVVAPHIERLSPIRSLLESDMVYPNMSLIAEQDLADYLPSPQTYEYEYTKTWIQNYDEDLNVIFCGAGAMMASVNEVSKALNADWIICAGFDGSSTTYAYLRENGATKYVYSLPSEQFTHECFEAMDAIQVKGLNPGDEGCNVSKVGDTIYLTGAIVTLENCPEVGETFHTVYAYYDPDDADGWWNWTDDKGPMLIGDGSSE